MEEKELVNPYEMERMLIALMDHATEAGVKISHPRTMRKYIRQLVDYAVLGIKTELNHIP